ncbi:MAG TPA: histidine triad nucleotide-binding protein [Candidatus Polarisedimenticolia bacterium]|jgi:histidine triad (HIT) family protein|nr:histidine triad nucleotide-binding protein [Candidatus Polarisedimenticolia bacterium]
MADCLFCKIARKEIPADVLYEDRLVLAFSDINPQAPVHVLIIPKAHHETLNDVSAEEQQLLGHMVLVATKMAGEKGLKEKGYRLVANCLASAGQSVFHVHIHLLGGRTFTWPPG